MGIQISPSVLNADLSHLADQVDLIAAVADWVHLDVMDNHFVPNLTFGLPVVSSLLANCRIPADCHLMIADPDRWAPQYAEAGAGSVTFHVEAARTPARICRDIRSAGARAGIAVRPGTEVDVLEPVLRELDMILVMTVEPGFGGQAFRADMLAKVARARAMADSVEADIWVQVDGGVDEATIERCAAAGANVFVAGSAVYRADDPAAMVTRLRQLAVQAGCR